jgi:Protein of unknown function (DUF3887)
MEIVMKWLLALLVIEILVITTSCSKQSKNPRTEQLLSIGSEVVNQLAQKEYDKVTGRFDQTMLSSLPPDKLQQTWDHLTQQVGLFQRQSGRRHEKVQQFDVVVVKCIFANAPFNVRIAFNNKDQISGLYFVPEEQP